MSEQLVMVALSNHVFSSSGRVLDRGAEKVTGPKVHRTIGALFLACLRVPSDKECVCGDTIRFGSLLVLLVGNMRAHGRHLFRVAAHIGEAISRQTHLVV